MHAMKTLRVCCQKLFYPNLSTTPSTQPSTSDSDRRKTIALTILLLLATGSQADPAATEPTKPRKFTFDKTPNSALTTDLATQTSNPLCLEFLTFLNGMGAKGLFNLDGTLVRETENIKSVKWETLDRESFMEGLHELVRDFKGQMLEVSLERITKPEWELQRATAHPTIFAESPLKIDGVWLYRLTTHDKYISRKAYTTHGLATIWPDYRPIHWFPKEAESWLGNNSAKPLSKSHSTLPAGNVEWINYKDQQYSVALMDLGDYNAPKPKTELIEISTLILDGRLNSFSRQACKLKTP